MRSRHYDLPPLDQLEAFEAAARHLSFTQAALELSLTQSAVSRQIASLEQHFEISLFRRLHRALQLTEDGQTLHRAVADVLAQLHHVSGQLRRETRVRTVTVTTTPGFAGLWLIPRLAGFTADRPGVDVRISAGLALVKLDRDGVDLAIRYQTSEAAGPESLLLFGEVVTPVCSPRLRSNASKPLKKPEDLQRHSLLQIESDDSTPMLDWPLWLRALGLEGLKPASTLQFSHYDQMIQAAVNGQGVALGRFPLVQGLIDQRLLVAPFKKTLASPRGYHLLRSEAASRKPEVQDFVAWLLAEVSRPAA